MTFVNETNVEPRRTIDYDRNIALYFKGTSGGSAANIEMFKLHWEDNIVDFSTKREFIDNGKKGDIRREILGLSIPPSLSVESKELVSVIIEALEAYGSRYRRESIDNIYVTLSPSIFKTQIE